jgi:hypothetical protein
MTILLLSSFSFLFAQTDQIKDKNHRENLSEQVPGRVPTEQELIDHLDRILAKGDIDIAEMNLYNFLVQFGKYDTGRGYVKFVQKVMEIPEFDSWNREHPDNAYEMSVTRLRILKKCKDYPGVQDFVIQASKSENPQIQCEAAATLLDWGNWDMAAPIIRKFEGYSLFQRYKDNRAIPLLENAVKTGSWQGRIMAAAALFYTYGDSTKYPQAALDIILHAPINTDDMNINRAKFLALDQVARFNLKEALPGLIRLAQDTAEGISPKCVERLVDLSGMGYSEATEALNDIKDHHSDPRIREFAKQGLITLQNKK